MNLTYVFFVVALVFSVSCDAYPYLYRLNDDSSPILTDWDIAQRDIFDPYGFNSILTRFVKRNSNNDIPRPRLIDFIKEEDGYHYV